MKISFLRNFCKGCASLSRCGFGVVTLELGVCLTQCHSMRKDGLNVFNLWIGNFVLMTMLTLTRFGFGVLNHGSYLWCQFICWTTCMLGTIYTYSISLVLFFIPIRHMDVQNHVSTRMHIRIQVYLCFKVGGEGVLMQQTPHQKWWKVWLIVVDVAIVIHLKVSMEFNFFIWLHWVSAILSTKVCVCVCVCVFSSFILFSFGQFCLWNFPPP